MIKFYTNYKILLFAVLMTFSVVALKSLAVHLNVQPIDLGSLHSAIVSGATFVIGFILSSTIADYKESERIPADVATCIEDMYMDTKHIHESYPVFDFNDFTKQLRSVASGFVADIRTKDYDSRDNIFALNSFFTKMEKKGVPPNFIVKLKQQQTILLRSRHRINYIQKIQFIPSATILARSIVLLVILTLLFTNVDGGLVIIGLISFVLLYMLLLIDVISTPFHISGKTRDDVSLFLVAEASQLLKNDAK